MTHMKRAAKSNLDCLAIYLLNVIGSLLLCQFPTKNFNNMMGIVTVHKQLETYANLVVN